MGNKRQRKIIIRLIIGALIVFLGLIVEFYIHRYSTNRAVVFRTEESTVQIYREKKWQDFRFRGANIPAAPLGESGSREEFARLFKQMADADVNVILVHTILSPVFYRAFFEYNLLTDKPLYLLHGIRLDEQNIKKYYNAYEDKLSDDFFEEIRRTIDVVHGKAGLKQTTGHNSGTYNFNISPYVIGYILGDQTDADFVLTTNEKNPHIMGFDGDYLYTRNASPYEAWLAAVGNYAISYEQEKYRGPCKLVSLACCFGIDPVGVNLANIQVTEKFNAGILAFDRLQETFIEF